MIRIQRIDDCKGLGVVACEDVSEGSILFTELPIVSCQFAYNKVCSTVSYNQDLFSCLFSLLEIIGNSFGNGIETFRQASQSF